jgi:hypothetical protein
MLVVIYQLALTAQCVSKAPVRLRGKDSMTAQCANWCDAENAGSQCGWCKCQACPNCKAERAQPGQPQSASMQLEQSQLQVFEPVADQPCFGQTPCLHTSASERVASGCNDGVLSPNGYQDRALIVSPTDGGTFNQQRFQQLLLAYIQRKKAAQVLGVAPPPALG